MDSEEIYFLHGRIAIVRRPEPKEVEVTGFQKDGKVHIMSMSHHAFSSFINSANLIEDKPTTTMNKLDYYKQFYPDAVEYQEKNQAYIREDQARFIAYGNKEVNAKSLFYRDIPSKTGVLQQFIFSEKAYLDAEKIRIHQEQLSEPYH